MHSCYALNIPTEAMKVVAGGTTLYGSYRLYRDIKPPKDLLDKVFPQIYTIDINTILDPTDKEFIKMLQFLACVLLQDAAILVKDTNCQKHKLFEHELFRTESFLTFAASVQSRALEQVNNIFTSIFLEQAAPEIVNQLARSNIEQTQLYEILREQSNKIDILNSNVSHLGAMILNQSSYIQSTPPINLNNTFSPILPIQQNQCNQIPLIPTNTHSRQISLNSEALSNGVPKYEMSRSIFTLSMLVKEWYHGIGDNPSIKYLETTYKSKWRQESKNKQFYHQRRKVIIEIERVAQLFNPTSIPSAVEMIDAYHLHLNQPKNQIPWLIAYIKENDAALRTYRI